MPAVWEANIKECLESGDTQNYGFFLFLLSPFDNHQQHQAPPP
jgi:hypothetical protein